MSTADPRAGLSLPAVAALALGIGATTAIFTLLQAVVIRPLPYPDADRLVAVRHRAVGLGLTELHQSDATFLHYRAGARLFAELGLYQDAAVNLSGGGAMPEQVDAVIATPSIFRLLHARPALGRLFTEADVMLGAPPAIVLSHAAWRSRFGGDPAIVGRTVTVNGAAREIIGVAAADFQFPRPGVAVWFAMRPNAATGRFADLTCAPSDVSPQA